MADEKQAAEVKPEAKPETKKGEVKKKLIKGRHHSAIKRHRQSLKRAAVNQTVHSAVRTAIKKVRLAVVAKNRAEAETNLKTAVSLLHRAAMKGILHHRNASRHVARLSSMVAHLGPSA